MNFEKQRIEKPWGHEVIWAVTETGQGKIIALNQGCKTSLHYHEKKDESFYLYSGQMKFFTDSYESLEKDESETKKMITMRAGDCWRVKPKILHRMEAITHCVIFEMSTPENLEDIIRLVDDYGRENV